MSPGPASADPARSDPSADAAPARPVSPWTPEDRLATLCMAVLVAVTLANVVARYLTDASFAWTEEISVIVMVLMVFAGAAGAALRNTHIRMDLLAERGGRAWRALSARLSGGATALVFALMAVLLARMGIDEVRYGELNSLDLPRWWFTFPEAALCAVVALRALGLGRRRAAGAGTDGGSAGDHAGGSGAAGAEADDRGADHGPQHRSDEVRS